MRISPVNYNIKTSFKGLWAYTEEKAFYNAKTDSFERKEWHVYCPFKDEDPDKVQEFLAGYKPKNYDPKKKYLIQEGGAFTFTEAEFLAYQAKKDASELTKKEKNIHAYAQICFYNSEIDAQRGAVNPNITYYDWEDPENILRVND